jgi:hypothetical protein
MLNLHKLVMDIIAHIAVTLYSIKFYTLHVLYFKSLIIPKIKYSVRQKNIEENNIFSFLKKMDLPILLVQVLGKRM